MFIYVTVLYQLQKLNSTNLIVFIIFRVLRNI